MYVHRLVAIAFIPNYNGLPQVNHKDENPSNNNVNNLEWCDGDYNLHYGTRNKKISKAMKGHFVCEKTRKAVGEAQKGINNHNSKGYIKMSCDSGEIIFESSREVVKYLKEKFNIKTNHSSILNKANGYYRYSYKGKIKYKKCNKELEVNGITYIFNWKKKTP